MVNATLQCSHISSIQPFVYSAFSQTSCTDAQQRRLMDPKCTHYTAKSWFFFLSTSEHINAHCGCNSPTFSSNNVTKVRRECTSMGSSRKQSEELRVYIVSYRVLCLPVLWGSLSPGGIRSTRRFVTTKKKQQRILLLYLKYPQALRSRQRHTQKRQTTSLRAQGERACFSWECVLPGWQTAIHNTYTSPGSPLSLRRDGGRRRWAGTAPWSTDRTVTPSALTRSLPHRWHATTYHSRALPKMF